MNVPHRTLTLILSLSLAICVSSMPRSAHAGINASGLEELLTTGAGLVSAALVGLATTAAGLSVGGGIFTSAMIKEEKAQAMHLYLNAQSHTAYAALYSVDPHSDGARDLAHIMSIPEANHDRFAEILFDSRATLAPLLTSDEGISRERSRTFTMHLFELVCAEDLLFPVMTCTPPS